MKIENTNRKAIQSSDQSRKTKVGVSNDITKIVSLLTNIYKDPIKAVVRELFANAIDSTKQAGSAEPVQVHLPTSISPQLSIRDFGVGMSDDFVHETYAMYGASTKDTTNDFIGGFGIGGKSPYAYTDSFSLTTWDGTHMRTYQMSKANMEVVSLATVPSTEPRGVKVTVPVRSEDIARFGMAGESILQWFPANSYVCNRPITDAIGNLDVVTKVGELCPTKNSFSDPVLLLNNIIYSWDSWNTQFREYVEVDQLHTLVDFHRVIPIFDIGEITLSPNRETVIMDPKTIAALGVKLRTYVVEKSKDLLDYVDTADYENIHYRLAGLPQAQRDYVVAVKGLDIDAKRRKYIKSLPLYKAARFVGGGLLGTWGLSNENRKFLKAVSEKVSDKFGTLSKDELVKLFFKSRSRARLVYSTGYTHTEVAYPQELLESLDPSKPFVRSVFDNTNLFARMNCILADSCVVDVHKLGGIRRLDDIFKTLGIDPYGVVTFNSNSEPDVKEFLCDFLEYPEQDIIVARDHLTKDVRMNTGIYKQTCTLFTQRYFKNVKVGDLMKLAETDFSNQKIYLVQSCQGSVSTYTADDLCKQLTTTYGVLAVSIPKSYTPGKRALPANVVVMDEEYRKEWATRFTKNRFVTKDITYAIITSWAEFNPRAAKIASMLLSPTELRLVRTICEGLDRQFTTSLGISGTQTEIFDQFAASLVGTTLDGVSVQGRGMWANTKNYNKFFLKNSYLRKHYPDLWMRRFHAKKRGETKIDQSLSTQIDII